MLIFFHALMRRSGYTKRRCTHAGDSMGGKEFRPDASYWYAGMLAWCLHGLMTLNFCSQASLLVCSLHLMILYAFHLCVLEWQMLIHEWGSHKHKYCIKKLSTATIWSTSMFEQQTLCLTYSKNDISSLIFSQYELYPWVRRLELFTLQCANPTEWSQCASSDAILEYNINNMRGRNSG